MFIMGVFMVILYHLYMLTKNCNSDFSEGKNCLILGLV